jgi:hypothetical protein
LTGILSLSSLVIHGCLSAYSHVYLLLGFMSQSFKNMFIAKLLINELWTFPYIARLNYFLAVSSLQMLNLVKSASFFRYSFRSSCSLFQIGCLPKTNSNNMNPHAQTSEAYILMSKIILKLPFHKIVLKLIQVTNREEYRIFHQNE